MTVRTINIGSPTLIVLTIAGFLSLFAAWTATATATATCFELRKIDASFPTTQVRVCDPVATPDCASWLYHGALSVGQSVQMCALGDVVWYEEWDEAAGAWGPTTEAHCEAGGVVEL